MLRGMIFEAERLTAAAAEFVTMDFVFLPSTRGLLQLPNVSGRSPGSRVVTIRLPSQKDPWPDLSSGVSGVMARRTQLRGQPRVGRQNSVAPHSL